MSIPFEFFIIHIPNSNTIQYAVLWVNETQRIMCYMQHEYICICVFDIENLIGIV
jgi:hypothetical protein